MPSKFRLDLMFFIKFFYWLVGLFSVFNSAITSISSYITLCQQEKVWWNIFVLWYIKHYLYEYYHHLLPIVAVVIMWLPFTLWSLLCCCRREGFANRFDWSPLLYFWDGIQILIRITISHCHWNHKWLKLWQKLARAIETLAIVIVIKCVFAVILCIILVVINTCALFLCVYLLSVTVLKSY